MKKFLLIYHSPKEALEQFATMSQEDAQKEMEVWMQWGEKNKDSIIDFGNPVGLQTVVSPEGTQEKNDDVTGYSVIQAENIESAKTLLRDHPSFMNNDGSTVSLYPINEM